VHVKGGTNVVDILAQTLARIHWSVHLNHHFERTSFRVKLVADPVYLVEIDLKHVYRMLHPCLRLIRLGHFRDFDLLLPGLLFFEQWVTVDHELELNISPLNLLLLHFCLLIQTKNSCSFTYNSLPLRKSLTRSHLPLPSSMQSPNFRDL